MDPVTKQQRGGEEEDDLKDRYVRGKEYAIANIMASNSKTSNFN